MAKRLSDNNYTKLDNGSWGAFIHMHYDGNLKTIAKGEVVNIITRNGETHQRVVESVVQSYKSGCKVALVPSEEVESRAKARYEAKKSKSSKSNTQTVNTKYTNYTSGPCPKCGTYCYGDCEFN